MIATNRKARHNFSVIEVFEAGVVLVGTEVKSLREGRASLTDAFATVDDGEVWLRNVHIPEYHHGSWTNHDPGATGSCCCTAVRSTISSARSGMLTSRSCRCRCTSPGKGQSGTCAGAR